jgi:hypothetical protein
VRAAQALALALLLPLLGACAERPLVGVTISNSPDQRGACLPPRPGGGC